jgi:GTPase SAR1 family protein
MSKNVFPAPGKCPAAGLLTPLLVDLGDRRVRLMLWDTSGDEDYRDMTVCHLAEAQAAVLLYAMDDRESFESVLDVWNPILEECSKVRHIVVLVGTKTDVSERTVRTEDIEKAKEELGENFFVSALDGSGVEELRDAIAGLLVEEFQSKKEKEIVQEMDVSDGEVIAVDGGCGCLLL